MVHTAALGSLRVLSRGSRGFLDSAIGVASILPLSVQNDQSWDSEAGKWTDHYYLATHLRSLILFHKFYRMANVRTLVLDHCAARQHAVFEYVTFRGQISSSSPNEHFRSHSFVYVRWMGLRSADGCGVYISPLRSNHRYLLGLTG